MIYQWVIFHRFFVCLPEAPTDHRGSISDLGWSQEYVHARLRQLCLSSNNFGEPGGSGWNWHGTSPGWKGRWSSHKWYYQMWNHWWFQASAVKRFSRGALKITGNCILILSTCRNTSKTITMFQGKKNAQSFCVLCWSCCDQTCWVLRWEGRSGCQRAMTLSAQSWLAGKSMNMFGITILDW